MTQFDTIKSAKNLKLIRKKMGFTQKQLGDLIGIAQCTVALCENGLRNLSIRHCYKLIEIAKKHDMKIEFNYLRPVKND